MQGCCDGDGGDSCKVRTLWTAIFNGFIPNYSKVAGILVTWSFSATVRSAQYSGDTCSYEPRGLANYLKAITLKAEIESKWKGHAMKI